MSWRTVVAAGIVMDSELLMGTPLTVASAKVPSIV
jgi:hypothetical protein